MNNDEEDVLINDIMKAAKKAAFEGYIDSLEKKDDYDDNRELREDDARNIIIALLAAASQMGRRFNKDEKYILSLVKATWEDVMASEEKRFNTN